MTFNDKGFQPLMTLNSALARSIKGVSPLPFIAIHCHFVLPKLLNILKLLNPNTEQPNRGVKPVRSCSGVFG